MTARPRMRTGTTLVELCITVAIVALAASMVTLAARRMESSNADDPRTQINSARRTALATAQPVAFTVMRNDSTYVVTALPDGGVLADSSFYLDRLTGMRREESHHSPKTNAH